MIDDVVIRQAGPEDAAVVWSLIRELAVYEGLEENVVSTPELLAETLRAGDVEAILAEHRGVTVGFALYYHNYSTFSGRRGIWLEDIFIRQEWRMRGVGLLLMSRISVLAAERGCPHVEWAVKEWNTMARDFYRRIGSHPVDGRIMYRLDGDGLANLAAQDKHQ